MRSGTGKSDIFGERLGVIADMKSRDKGVGARVTKFGVVASTMSESTGRHSTTRASKRAIAEGPRLTPTTASSRSTSAQGGRYLAASSHFRFIDGRGRLMGRELLRQMVRSQRSLHITTGESCDFGFEKRSGQTVSLTD